VPSLDDQVRLLLGVDVETATALASGDLEPTGEQTTSVAAVRLGWDTAEATEAREPDRGPDDPFEGLTAEGDA
jgi:hypothetical protein